MKIVCIGGMDGVGKTTLTNQLSSHGFPISIEVGPKSELIKEVLKLFEEGKIDNYFYQTIFLYANIERYHKLIKRHKDKEVQYLLSDRTFLEDVIFAEALLNDEDFNIYKQLFNYHLKKVFSTKQTPDVYILLESSYETCEKRMNDKKHKEGRSLKNSFFNHDTYFYKKLHNLYTDKSSMFFQILKEHNIEYRTLKTDNFTTMDTYKSAKELLSLQ